MDPARTAVRSLSVGRDRRLTADVGRCGRLELVFAVRRGRTVLADAYAEPPFRVGRCFPDEDGLRMILASSAPGIFAGDQLQQRIRLEPGARVRLTSQSALQVHPSSDPARPARLHSTYHVEENASLHCHWDPMIPFAGARFEQQIVLQLSESAQLYWSDAFMSGRAFHGPRSCFARGDGEQWAFASLGHELKIMRRESLEYLERYRIAPGDGRVTHPWVAGTAAYFGTVLASGQRVQAGVAELLHHELSRLGGVRAAADAMDSKLLIVRLIGDSGVPFHDARTLSALRLSAMLLAGEACS